MLHCDPSAPQSEWVQTLGQGWMGFFFVLSPRRENCPVLLNDNKPKASEEHNGGIVLHSAAATALGALAN